MSDEPTVPAPQAFKTACIVWLVAGAINMTMGWVIGYAFWLVMGTIVGATCATLSSIIMCPCGLFALFLPLCGLASLLIVPIGILELIFGILGLVQPETVKKIIPWMGLTGLFSWVLGDFVTPIAGIVTVMVLRDPEVRDWLQS